MDLDIDPMLFFSIVIEDQIAVQETMTLIGMTGVADIATRHIESAQAELDRLIAEDTTWTDCYGTWCVMVHEDTDPELGEIQRCTVHNYTVIADAYVCEGYTAAPYAGGH